MEITQVAIKDLKENPQNPRHITQAEMNKLIRSIKEFGFIDPMIVNKHKDRYNIIIGGHQRMLAAKRLGMKTVPVVYVELDKNKENMLNIALNKISGDWDEGKLAELLQQLIDQGNDVTLTGFDEPMIEELLAAGRDSERDKLIDTIPPVPIEAKSKPGEIYALGNHRIMCGDSTKEDDFKRLMNGKIGDMCWTDPPYGVSYKGTNNPNGKDWGVMENDALRGSELGQMLVGIYGNVASHTKANAALYTCYASINHTIFELALNSTGFSVKQQLIWEKGHVLGHSDYHWSHEPILYCRKAENTEWYGDRTHKTFILGATIEQLNELTKEKLIEIISKIREDSDLLKVKKDNVSEYLHATQKPVELSTIMIKNSSRPGEIVIEPCCGSGSTLIACEVTKRICYAMELDPRYMDVILTRWEIFTGKDAIRESDGKSWKEIKRV